MRNSLKATVIIILLLVCLPAFADDLNILFIGNSYVYINELPDVLEDMLEADGIQAHVEMAVGPGYQLSQHANSQKTLNTISDGKWDFVILQEQSTLPIIAEDRQREMIPAIQILDRTIKKTGAQTMLFMTWGRRDGLSNLGSRGFNQMQDKLSSAYWEAGRRVDAIVAPVGEAWRQARIQKPYFPLWNDDGSHLSNSGTYLTACVFFYVITEQTPVGNQYKPKLSSESIAFLQDVAATVVSTNNLSSF